MNKSAVVVLALSAMVLSALYLFARPQPQPAAPALLDAAGAATVAPAAAPEFEFEVAKGKVTGPPSLTASKGQRVTVRVRSDVADELHVHGYELSAPVPAGEPVALTFIAAQAGRFEIELHGAHLELGALEVRP